MHRLGGCRRKGCARDVARFFFETTPKMKNSTIVPIFLVARVIQVQKVMRRLAHGARVPAWGFRSAQKSFSHIVSVSK